MKTITIIFLLALCSCTKEGEIRGQSSKTFLINGKEYKFYHVVPSDGAPSVWILVPLDKDFQVPQVTSSRLQSGKTTIESTVITIP